MLQKMRVVNSDPLFFCHRYFLLPLRRCFPSRKEMIDNPYAEINNGKPD